MRRKRKNTCMAFSRTRPAWYLSVTHIRPTFTPTGMRAAGEAAGGSSVRLSGRSRKTHWDACRGRLGLPLYQVPEAHTCMGGRSDHSQKHGDTHRRRRWRQPRWPNQAQAGAAAARQHKVLPNRAQFEAIQAKSGCGN